jgi:hypothetical protein
MISTLASALLLVFAPLHLLMEMEPKKIPHQTDRKATKPAGENISKPNPNKSSHTSATTHHTSS